MSSAPDATIVVSLPAEAEFAATLRVVAASVGFDAGLSVDEIDDLRIGVSEVHTALADAVGDESSRCSATFDSSEGTVIVTIDVEGDQQMPVLELDELASTIMSGAVDDHVVRARGATIVKHALELL